MRTARCVEVQPTVQRTAQLTTVYQMRGHSGTDVDMHATFHATVPKQDTAFPDSFQCGVGTGRIFGKPLGKSLVS